VPSIAFYISGHGFGHTSREIEVINAVAPRMPAWRIVVRTSAPRWLFERTARPPLTLIEGPCDTGVAQIDSVRLDEQETVRAAEAFYADLPRLVQAEVNHLQRHDARLVIADAPPLGCAAAAAHGIPSVVLSNFTWDWIYERYPVGPGSPLIGAVQNAYRLADEAWRMPLHGGFRTFSRVVDVPLVARHATVSRDEVRRRLGLPKDTLLALSSFGGYGLHDFDPARLDCLDRWHVVTTARRTDVPVPSGVYVLEESAVYEAGMQYEDLVAAVEVVVTKPGYGIISECIANGTALLYTSRGNFAEYEVMVEQMPRVLRCGYIDREALVAGRWRESLDRLYASPPAQDRPRTDGAEVVASMIAGMLSGG